MFSIKSFFGFGQQPTLELTNIKKEKNMFARITEDNRLFSPTGEFIGTYSRRRDAVRGANRRGFKLAA